jgi:hypothetical protein
MADFYKYPRTRHLVGSRIQQGDEDLKAVPFSDIIDRHIVVEEKLDGANSGISFRTPDDILLQCRGHELRGGPRERHFALFKAWANTNHDTWWEVLGTRYIMYGEWMFAKHSEFYDLLPHYFMEFDIFDKETETFLSTPRRHEMLDCTGVVSVPVLYQGQAQSMEHLQSMIGTSLYKSPNWQANLAKACEAAGTAVDPKETDMSPLSEGLYIKVEEDGQVVERLKFVRAEFVARILESESHWMERPIVQNGLAPGVELW